MTRRQTTTSSRENGHLDELLDEALDETFPASDPPAILEPMPRSRSATIAKGNAVDTPGGAARSSKEIESNGSRSKTRMSDNLELTEQAKRDCAEALSKVLADTFALYLKTHNFHWNVEGPQFLGLHEKFEEQYNDLWESLDEIAERIRALGQPAPGTTKALGALAGIEETEGVPTASEMLGILVKDNEAVARTIRAGLAVVQEAGDEASAGLLSDRLAYHEKEVWMMKSMLAG